MQRNKEKKSKRSGRVHNEPNKVRDSVDSDEKHPYTKRNTLENNSEEEKLMVCINL